MPKAEKRQLPFWIWILAFILLQLSSEYSIFFLYTPGTSDVYLTFSIGIILIYWLGPKVLIIAYLNALINCYFWGHEHLYSWPIFALPESVFFFLSWWFFIRLGKGKFWLPDLNNVIRFLLLGVSIPLMVYMIFLKYLLVLFGELEGSELWGSILASYLGDFMPTLAVSMPVLYYLSKPVFQRLNWHHDQMEQVQLVKSRKSYIEIISYLILVALLATTLNFTSYWYLFGLLSLVVSVRFGFGPTALMNLFILFIIYFLPATIYGQTSNLYFDQNELLEIYLGINLLALFSIISGRVISDYRAVQLKIRTQMTKVEQVNRELDRFVYSVSHDLVAPLKSIKGLTSLLKKDDNKDNTSEYISRIEESADKLDEFVKEILDYSRSTRKDLSLEKVKLEDIINEQIANHRFIRGFDQLNFDLSGITVNEITTDVMRLRIILNNLISNAIKFTNEKSEAKISFQSEKVNDRITITVEDNGNGIPPEHQDKIFDMFYRASIDNSGSGLGLFIAKEAVSSMKGSIKVETEVGVGSRFIVSIPDYKSSVAGSNTC